MDFIGDKPRQSRSCGWYWATDANYGVEDPRIIPIICFVKIAPGGVIDSFRWTRIAVILQFVSYSRDRHSHVVRCLRQLSVIVPCTGSCGSMKEFMDRDISSRKVGTIEKSLIEFYVEIRVIIYLTNQGIQAMIRQVNGTTLFPILLRRYFLKSINTSSCSC